MNRENIILNTINGFIEKFKEYAKEGNIEAPELSDNVIKESITEYFNKEKFGEARDYFYDVVKNHVDKGSGKINWSLKNDELVKTNEYISWNRYHNIYQNWCYSAGAIEIEKIWVELNGKTHTDEEAAKIAADKWCEVIFGWHLQDNGALDETHGGGFPACVLGTLLAEKCKEGITDEVKERVHELFYQYYLKMIHYMNTHDQQDEEWLKETLKDKDDDYTWKYGFDTNMYCDYDPCWAIYLILVNSGVEDRDARNICPWKTGISIRREDNAVLYNTYRSQEEL